MIIIKTKTGETLVNEKEIVSVVHDRDEHTARVNEKQVVFGLRRPPIDNVESVIYINDQTGKDWRKTTRRWHTFTSWSYSQSVRTGTLKDWQTDALILCVSLTTSCFSSARS